jgi:MacB-like periplasmic core domain/FtsX-like permease family
VTWYRFRATFRDRWSGYLTIVLLVGLLGGLAMGAIAGARRTQSSFPTLMALTNTSTLLVLSGVANPAIGETNGYNPAVERTIAHLPYVKAEKSTAQINLIPFNARGLPVAAAEGYSFNGSVNGEQFSQDRVIIADGRLANPRRANEFVMDSTTARHFGFHLGQVVTFWAYSNAEGAKLTTTNPSQVIKELKPFLRIRVKLVGVGAVSPSELMQDAVDTGHSTVLLFTPALTDQLLSCCVNTTLSALQLSGGTVHESAVETEISKVLPKGLPSDFAQLSTVVAKAEQTIKPESIALGVFGVMALFAMLVIAGQLIGRRLRQNATDIQVLRSLGAKPAMTYLDELVGIVGAVLVGSLLAGLVAIGLSPLAPLGPARPYLPHGANFDWTVLGFGLALIVMLLVSVSAVVAIRLMTRAASWRGRSDHRGSRAANAAALANLPVSAVTGIRFALEPGTGRNTVPVRSAILGAVIAAVIVTSTVTFGASLQHLVARPALYGWNFSYDLNGGDGLGDIPAAPVANLLNRDPYVNAWSGIYFGTIQIDGQNVPAMGASPRAKVGPPILSGHAFDKGNQVVLGTATLAQLHKKLGDMVEVGAVGAATTPLKIVGTATLPSIGIGGTAHLEMGSGAVLSYQLIPAHERNLYGVPPGPNAVLVRVKPGASRAVTLSSLNTILTKTGARGCCGAQVDAVQRPAQIINYGSLGSTPGILGGALAAGAVVALGLTLIASVRRRRRDLALLKILGFTHGQLAAAIAWQSSVAVGIGTIVGVPLGIVTGNEIWDLFAREINAVPQPTVPLLSVVLIVVGGLVMANIVAAIPGRIAARTPTALLLRAE